MFLMMLLSVYLQFIMNGFGKNKIKQKKIKDSSNTKVIK